MLSITTTIVVVFYRWSNPGCGLPHLPDPDLRMKRNIRMNDVIGIAWYKDEATFRRALTIFIDSGNMPCSFDTWRALVEQQIEMIKESGTIALRADINPEGFPDWCDSRGFKPDFQGRIAFVNHIELEYRKTGKGTVIE